MNQSNNAVSICLISGTDNNVVMGGWVSGWWVVVVGDGWLPDSPIATLEAIAPVEGLLMGLKG